MQPTDVDVWTVEDEAIYRPLRRKILRIEARRRKDLAGRVRRYGARRRKSNNTMPKDQVHPPEMGVNGKKKS